MAQAPQAAAAPAKTPSGGLPSDQDAYRSERLPFPLSADVPWRPYVSPLSMARAADDAEMLEALRQRVERAEHVVIAPPDVSFNDVVWLISGAVLGLLVVGGLLFAGLNP